MLNGFYYNFKDEMLGIVAGTVERPDEIESRLQDWQKEQRIYNTINAKYGTPAERAAISEKVAAAKTQLDSLDIAAVQASILEATDLTEIKTQLIDLCNAVQSLKTILTGK